MLLANCDTLVELAYADFWYSIPFWTSINNSYLDKWYVPRLFTDKSGWEELQNVTSLGDLTPEEYLKQANIGGDFLHDIEVTDDSEWSYQRKNRSNIRLLAMDGCGDSIIC